MLALGYFCNVGVSTIEVFFLHVTHILFLLAVITCFMTLTSIVSDDLLV